MRRISDAEESWEYVSRPTVIEWAQEHVALAVAAAALIWFGVVYVMTLVLDLFMR
ncbi:MAG: hypothetical protein ACTHNU_06540 [Gaiellales bacterium]